MDRNRSVHAGKPYYQENWIERPRLLARLDDALAQRLTLITAPAGYGKSSLLSQWLNGIASATIWLPLTESDNEPQAFWLRMLERLEASGITSPAWKGLSREKGVPHIRRIIETVHEGLHALADSLVIVMDDCHLIRNGDLCTQLGQWSAALPRGVHLVMAGRTYPLGDLAKKEISEDVLLLTQEHLAFNPREAAQFLDHRVPHQLSAADHQAVFGLTEGWPACLNLAAGILAENPSVAQLSARFGKGEARLDAFLTEEVFARQPPELRQFMARIAFLDRFSAALCARVTQCEDSTALIRQIRTRNLFLIPLDQGQQWFRFHHLFRDFLRSVFTTLNPDTQSRCRIAAGRWFAESGYVEEAIGCFLAAGEREQAADLLEVHCDDLMAWGKLPFLLKASESLGRGLMQARPKLWIAQATAMIMTYRWYPFQANIRKLSSAKEQLPQWARAELEILLANFQRQQGKLGDAIRHCQTALEHFQADQQDARSAAWILLAACTFFQSRFDDTAKALDHCIQACQLGTQTGTVYLGARAMMGDVLVARGHLRQAEAGLKATLAEIDEQRERLEIPMASMVYAAYSSVLLESGRLDGCERMLTRGLDLAERGDLDGPLLRLLLTACRCSMAQGAMDRAETFLIKAFELEAKRNVQQWQIRLLHGEAAVFWSAKGQLSKAEEYLLNATRPREDEVSCNDPYLLSLEAQVLSESSPEPGLTARLDNKLTEVEACDWMEAKLRLLVALALCHHRLGREEMAISALGEALTIAEPEGWVQVFRPPSEELAKRLIQLSAGPSKSSRMAAFARLIWGNREELKPTLPSPVPLDSSGSGEELTPREIEVLTLIATGISNQELADRLFISKATLKTHINRIYAKLGIERRAQAVLRAKQLGLI